MDDEIRKTISEIQEYYKKRANDGKYATSPDFNLREVEIHYLSQWLNDGKKILDVGCGNGYSTLSHAARFNSCFVGIDFVPEIIQSANELKNQFKLLGSVDFKNGDVTDLRFENESFDIVISERCLLNLPAKDLQWTAIKEISRVLKKGGHYLMLEGSLQGLHKMNDIREKFDLEPIPEAEKSYNWFSNKFDEDEMLSYSKQHFSSLETIQRFGMYFFISRVIHPLLVSPDQPKYDARINEIAKNICLQIPDFENIGHEALYVHKK
ncbi:MAG: class I SAM-dependent methyltransferase [Desulfobacula sp.]|nr:class I SAM-dependent methyltransferase [Desulfobacula sp.]